MQGVGVYAGEKRKRKKRRRKERVLSIWTRITKGLPCLCVEAGESKPKDMED